MNPEETSYFLSEDPSKPTLEDEFRMDLCATLGYKSVQDLLEYMDAFEYDFWFEKYKKACFGPTTVSQQLSLISYFVANSFSKTNAKLDDFLINIKEPPSAEEIAEMTAARYHKNVVNWLKKCPKDEDLEKQPYSKKQIMRIKQGFNIKEDQEELQKLARVISDPYRKGLLEKCQQSVL